MTRHPARVLLLVVLIALAGCTAQRHIKAGDAAAAGGDMRGALYHYDKAVAHKQSLSRSKDFMSKYAVAESRVAYQDAVRLRSSGRYEEAADQLRKAIERDPSYAEPGELLPLVLIEASSVRYVRAVQAADAGDLGQARLHLDRALQQNPRNTQAAAALRSLSPGTLPADTPGLAAYRAGMERSAERRWPEAVELLKKAIAEGPGLLPAREALHDAAAELTTSRRLTHEASALIDKRELGPAMQRLRLSLEVWPVNSPAQRLLAEARQQRDGADTKLAEATDAAGERRWEQAIALAEAGLAIDRSHEALQAALGKFKGLAAGDYAEQGKALLADKKLTEAEAAFARAVELNKTLSPALHGLRDAQTRLAHARDLTAIGSGRIDTREMAGAIKALNQALKIWPFNDQAKQLLAKATEQQRLAGERFGASVETAEVGRWDAAIELADEALALDRSYTGLAEHRAALPRRAAEDHTRQGAAHLAAQDLDEAEADYRKALAFVARHRPALSGLASVYQAEGKALEAQGLTGAALLRYALGRSYQRDHAVAEAWSRARAAVRDRVGMGLGLSVDPGRGGVVGPDQLGGSLNAALAGYRPNGLAVGGKDAPYVLNVIIREGTIVTNRIGSVNRQHDYTVRELHHNREYDRVRDRLRHEEALWRSCRDDYLRHVRDHNRAKHRASSLHPGAPPKKPAGPPVQQPGQDDADYQQQLQQYQQALSQYNSALTTYNHKNSAYKSALSHAKRLKSKCDSLHSALRRQERVVSDWRRRLSKTPKEIWVSVKQTWPYTVETYEKTGRLAVTSELIDTATGKVIERSDHSAEFAARDQARLNANPDIGLREDRLELPADAVVRRSLSGDLAGGAAPWAVEAAVKHRLDAVYQQIEALDKAGNKAGALEARADAAVLLGVVDPEGSAKQVLDLAERYAQ